MSTETLFFNPHASMALLVDSGISEGDAIAHLVRLKGEGEHIVCFDRTTYFDPRELNRIVERSA